MRSAKVLLAVALVLGVCAVSNAGTVYNQLGTPTWGALHNYNNSVIADDFTLAGSTTLTSLSFVGSFTGVGDWTVPTLDGFTVKIYANNAGTPGTVLSTQTITSGWTGGEDNKFAVWTVPLSNVNLAAGTYWISYAANVTEDMGTGGFDVRAANGNGADASSSDPQITYVVNGKASYKVNSSTYNGRYWNDDGAGTYSFYTGTYDGTTFPSAWSTGDNSHPEAVDLSFSLIGTTAATPEPGTLALLATGLMGLLAYAWRKRK